MNLTSPLSILALAIALSAPVFAQDTTKSPGRADRLATGRATAAERTRDAVGESAWDRSAWDGDDDE